MVLTFRLNLIILDADEIDNAKLLVEVDMFNKLCVSGFKSICNKVCIDIKPLTILAGANSSGKSSMMQPLLMLKQTLDAQYDPGVLKIDGPNVKFTSTDQFISKNSEIYDGNGFLVWFGFEEYDFTTTYYKGKDGLHIGENIINTKDNKIVMNEGMDKEKSINVIKDMVPYLYKHFDKSTLSRVKIKRDRCFLQPVLDFGHSVPTLKLEFPVLEDLISGIIKVIHVSGLRGNPERSYAISGRPAVFPGNFEKYVSSVIYDWYEKGNKKLRLLNKYMELLGLTWKIEPKKLHDTQVEIRIGRLPKGTRGGAKDLVNIADVGFGVSQTLPVVVALLVAEPGQLVFIEQPEIHLHPRAQLRLADLLCETANRGVNVVVETHSSILIRGVQTFMVKDHLSNDVAMHWFTRDRQGATVVTSAILDSYGSFGAWPGDFDEVSLGAETAYLDAVEEKVFNE